MVKFLLAVLPSAGVLFVFWIGIKSLLEADRRERAAQARFEAEQDARDARERDVREHDGAQPSSGS